MSKKCKQYSSNFKAKVALAANKGDQTTQSHQAEVDNLYRQIGQLSVERDFLARKLDH